jgi:hypothetical protein
MAGPGETLGSLSHPLPYAYEFWDMVEGINCEIVVVCGCPMACGGPRTTWLVSQVLVGHLQGIERDLKTPLKSCLKIDKFWDQCSVSRGIRVMGGLGGPERYG